MNKDNAHFQKDFLSTGVCLFANSSLYPECNPNMVYDRFKCNTWVNASNPLEHNSNHWSHKITHKNGNPPKLIQETLVEYEKFVDNWFMQCCDRWSWYYEDYDMYLDGMQIASLYNLIDQVGLTEFKTTPAICEQDPTPDGVRTGWVQWNVPKGSPCAMSLIKASRDLTTFNKVKQMRHNETAHVEKYFIEDDYNDAKAMFPHLSPVHPNYVVPPCGF